MARKKTKKKARKSKTKTTAKRKTKKKTAKKTKAKKTTSKRKTKATTKKTTKAKTKRKPNKAFMRPMTPSSTLAAIVGGTPLPRTQVTKKIWSYIKRNNLQDPNERRYIRADDKLKDVFGGKNRVSMFEMTKLVSKHLK